MFFELCSDSVNSPIRDVVKRQANPAFLKEKEYRIGIKVSLVAGVLGHLDKTVLLVLCVSDDHG